MAKERTRPARGGDRRTARGEKVTPARPQGTIFGMPRPIAAVGFGILFALLVVTILGQIVDAGGDIAGVQPFPDQGRRVLAAGETFDAYNSYPPTSGPHPTVDVPRGIYGAAQPAPFDVPPDAVTLLNVLEEGGIVVAYDPAVVSSAEIAQLEQFAVLVRQGGPDAAPQPNLVVTPLPGLAGRARTGDGEAAAVVATAWGHLLPLPNVSEEGSRGGLADFVKPAARDGFYGRFILDAAGWSAAVSNAGAGAATTREESNP